MPIGHLLQVAIVVVVEIAQNVLANVVECLNHAVIADQNQMDANSAN
jgi:hypothetical protein